MQKESATGWLSKQLCHPELVSGSCHRNIIPTKENINNITSTSHPAQRKVRGGCATRKAAFTLAEVLITLGVIGVVAALTLPALTANYRKKEVVTKLRKVYTVMNQAIIMSSAQNGETKYWVKDCGASTSPSCSIDEVEVWFKQYLGKYLQTLKIEKGIRKSDSVPVLYVYFNDGSILGIRDYIYDMDFFIDKNALDKPKSGRNYFYFRFNPSLVGNQTAADNRFAKMGTFEPVTFRWNGTRKDLMRQDVYGCKENGGVFCAKLIQFDGWEIKDDYPVRF